MRNFNTFVQHFSSYVEEFGDGYVPIDYVSSDGYALGNRVRDIRSKNTKLNAKERKKVNKLGFEWDGRIQRIMPYTFERYYLVIKEYYEKHGNCHISQKYVNENGISVGVYVSYIRKFKHTLNDLQCKKLDDIHFIWGYKNKRLPFDDFCRLYKEYERRFGNKYMSNRYITPDGILLGQMCRNIRTGRRKTTEEEKKKLNEIGFVWDMDKYCLEKGIICDNRGKKKMFA